MAAQRLAIFGRSFDAALVGRSLARRVSLVRSPSPLPGSDALVHAHRLKVIPLLTPVHAHGLEPTSLSMFR